MTFTDRERAGNSRELRNSIREDLSHFSKLCTDTPMMLYRDEKDRNGRVIRKAYINPLWWQYEVMRLSTTNELRSRIPDVVNTVLEAGELV